MSRPLPARLLIVAAGITGALGVAAAARASHAGDATLTIAANFLLFHAPVFLGLSFLAGNRVAVASGVALGIGLVVFAGDLAMRSATGNALFPTAAPIGGGGLMLGWVLVAAAGIWGGGARK